MIRFFQSLLKQLKTKFLNISFRKKLFLVYLIVAILPMAALQYYSYRTVRTQLTSQTYNNINNTISQINKNIENTLDSYVKVSSLLYMDSILRGYLTSEYTDDSDYIDAYYQYINRSFLNILVLNSGIENITIYTSNLSFPSDGLYIQHIDTASFSKTWKQEIDNSRGKVVFGNMAVNSSGRNIFSMARFMDYNKLKVPYGILTFNIYTSEIYSLIEKESKNKQIFVTNADGEIVSCKDSSLISKNVFQELKLDNPADLKSSGSFNINYNNEKHLMVYNTMKNGWKTIVLIPYSSFLMEAQLESTKLLLVSLISILLAAVLIFLTSEIITKRLKVLVHQIRKVEKGNFNISMKNMGHDEVGELSDAFTSMSSQLNILIKEVYEKDILKRKAEMDNLQAQINPHFLYNILSSISSLALRQKDSKVHEMVNYLAKFYRISLNKGKKVIPVSEEVELTKNYISIQQIRFEGLLHIHYEIDEGLFACKTIKLVLQPFLENCINHAIWDDDRGINVNIRIYRDDARILFEIIDDGAGIPPEKLDSLLRTSSSSGYGIKNVHERIQIYYGEEYGVHLFSRQGIGTTVQISIPAYQ